MPTGSPPILGLFEGICDVGGFKAAATRQPLSVRVAGLAPPTFARKAEGSPTGLSSAAVVAAPRLSPAWKEKAAMVVAKAVRTASLIGARSVTRATPAKGGNQFGGGASPGNANSAGFGFGGTGGLPILGDNPGYGGGAGGGGGYYGGGGTGGSPNPAGGGGGSGYVDPLATSRSLFTGVVPFLDLNDLNFNGYVIVTGGRRPRSRRT